MQLVNVNEKKRMMEGKKRVMNKDIAEKLAAQQLHPSKDNETNLVNALSRFKDLYADYGDHRKKEVEFHLKQLERQIVPTNTTKMSLWTLEQDESFFKNRKKGSLSHILTNELGVTEEQISLIQERRTRIKSLLSELEESLRLVKELQVASEAKNAKFEERMAQLQSVFTPQQVGQLVLWVNKNRAAISKLKLYLPDEEQMMKTPY
ncbi:unnamed protein product [Choristocarpus tenellus]